MTPRIEFKPLEADGDFDGDSPSTRLSATGRLVVGQAAIHIHIELIESVGGKAINQSLQSDVSRVAEQCGCRPDELTTIEVCGREYVAIAFPFAR